jgi:hypothetical protein
VPVITTAAIGVLLGGQFVAQYFYGEARIPRAVSAEVARSGSANIAVRLDFTPESFNLTYLSAMGNVAQTSGDTIYMAGVSGPAIRAIAGQYWVAGVSAWHTH